MAIEIGGKPSQYGVSGSQVKKAFQGNSDKLYRMLLMGQVK